MSNFTFEELTDSESHPELVPQNRIDAKKYMPSCNKLIALLDTIRHILGDKPLKVDSGFRNPALNVAVRSKSENSKHTLFEAADILPSGISIKEAFAALIMAQKGGLLPTLRKVLQEGTWLHVEVMTEPNQYRGFFVSKDGNLTWSKVA